MIALPRQLVHWKSQLALFPEDIALVLGPMVARLSALIGGSPFDQAPEGLPDGFGGITGRGSYERLLTSEWLLLEELPDEFLRRTVSGEHLFLERIFQADSAAKQTIALFDAGADQLGAPRLAQLAILIAMAKRAEEAGATLKWGIFQDASAALRTGVTKALIRELLEARCGRSVTARDIQLWMEVPEVRTSSEIWFAGAEALIEAARDRKVSALIIADEMEPSQPQRIQVRAFASGEGRVRDAFLDSPTGATGVRILRDPFGAGVGGRQATSIQVDLSSNILFSVDGRKLFIRGEKGAVITFPIPNSPLAKVPAPQAYLPLAGQSIVAVGQTASRRRTVAIAQGEGQLVVHTLSKRGATAKKIEAVGVPGDWWATPPDASLRPLAVLKSTCCFIDSDGTLMELTGTNTLATHKVNACASRATPKFFVYVVRGEKPLVMFGTLDKADKLGFESSGRELPPMPHDTEYYFNAFGLCNLVAYSREESRCVLAHNLKFTELDIPRSRHVVGLANVGEPDAAIVALNEDKLRVEKLSNGSWHTLFAVSSPIVRAAASDAGPVVAYITEAGEVGVYSYAHNTMLLQVAAGTGQ